MKPPRTAARWEKMPRGWTEESRAQMWHSLVGDSEHKVTECIRKMQDKDGVDDPGAFCAALADRVEGPGWRKKKKNASLDDLDDLEREMATIERQKASLERDLFIGDDSSLEREIQRLEARLKRLQREKQDLEGAMEQQNFGMRIGSTAIAARLLPRALQNMITQVGLKRQMKYEVRTYDKYQLAVGAGHGSRAAVIVYDLETGMAESHVGGWGGGALGVREQSPADNFSGPWHPMQDGLVVVKGTMGAEKRIFLTMNKSTLARLTGENPLTASANLRVLAARRGEKQTNNGWELTVTRAGGVSQVHGGRKNQVVSFEDGRVTLRQLLMQPPYVIEILNDTYEGDPLEAALRMTSNHPALR